MTESSDKNAEGMTPPQGGGGGGGLGDSSSADRGPEPIFVSFIYDFEGTEPKTGISGDGTGKPGTIGAPINDHPPRFRVFTYPFIPFRGKNIANT